MKTKSFLILGFLLLFVFSFVIPDVSAGGEDKGAVTINREFHEGDYLRGWKITPFDVAEIYLDAQKLNCYTVKAGKTYFVPTRTTSEWEKFVSAVINNPALGIELGLCPADIVVKGEIYDSSQGGSAEASAYDIYLEKENQIWRDLLNYYHGDINKADDSFNDIRFWSLAFGGAVDPSIETAADAVDLNTVLGSTDLGGGYYSYGTYIPDNFFTRYSEHIDSYLLETRDMVHLINDVPEDSEVITKQDREDYRRMTTGETPPGCFVEGTSIKTPNGAFKIETLSVGDFVVSYNLKNNQFVNSKIKEFIVHRNYTNQYYLIKTANSQVEVIGIHPFYVGDGKYKKAEELKEGESIFININGGLVKEKILSKEIVKLPEFITVYNLELDENSPKNYFANGYLVHNKYTY